MVKGISLANKSQLLFGFAVVVILAGALSVPWIRTYSLVQSYQAEVAKQVAEAYLAGGLGLGGGPFFAGELPEAGDSIFTLDLSLAMITDIDVDEAGSIALAEAYRRYLEDPAETEHYERSETDDGRPRVVYVRGVRHSELLKLREISMNIDLGPLEPGVADPIEAFLVVDHTSQFAQGQLLTSRVYIIAAGLVGSLLAVLVFYLILTKLILRPVRTLRETTEKLQEGDLTIRSEISTGDEFQQLSEAFNTMLDRVERSQAQLRSMNESLDLKVNELAEANVGLYESNRFKSEFLANVSHELRTPLNSIIGFAELLEEIARNDANIDPKRMRYLTNILTSGRSLQEMINDLLDLAKIEAGRMEVSVEPTSVSDLVEGLIGIMGPQAENKQIELRTHLASNVPVIETDAGKLQQILYNFLSNAIKFTPDGGIVTITADRVTRQDNSLGVRLAVGDTGPGIPEDMQDVIFEKFRQADSGHTREHSGTGLGLAICRELAQLLGAGVSFASTPGAGAKFFVDLPLTYQLEQPQPLMA